MSFSLKVFLTKPRPSFLVWNLIWLLLEISIELFFFPFLFSAYFCSVDACTIYMLYSHIQIHAEHYDTMKTSDTVFWKNIPLSLFERLRLTGSWRPNRTATYWPPTLMAISVVSFSFTRAAQPEAWGPTPLGAGFLYHILSPTGLVSKLTHFLSSPSYIIVQSPTQYLWNGMFDRHQAEITVMQFTDHSLPVHQSMIVPRDFT